MATEQSMAHADRSISKSKFGLTRAGGRRRLNLRILIGAGILTFFVVIAVVAPLIAPYDPLLPNPGPLAGAPQCRPSAGQRRVRAGRAQSAHLRRQDLDQGLDGIDRPGA
jgi:hypothetical protein